MCLCCSIFSLSVSFVSLSGTLSDVSVLFHLLSQCVLCLTVSDTFRCVCVVPSSLSVCPLSHLSMTLSDVSVLFHLLSLSVCPLSHLSVTLSDVSVLFHLLSQCVLCLTVCDTFRCVCVVPSSLSVCPLSHLSVTLSDVSVLFHLLSQCVLCLTCQ